MSNILFDHTKELSVLLALGNIVETNINVHTSKINKAIEQFKDDWKIYNPRDTENNRFGLSLTSLDGGLSGVPDLDSLSLYHRETGIDFLEEDFTTPTPVLEAIRDYTEVFNKYDIGRSHIIQFNKGGHFPRHRDLDNTFRLICFLDCSPPDNMIFTYNDTVPRFKQGVFYFVNTINDHSLFCFKNNQSIIVINAMLTEKNVDQLYRDRKVR